MTILPSFSSTTSKPYATRWARCCSVFGYSVETFASADAFLAQVSTAAAGCIVADVRMPGMDGIELVRELARRKSRCRWC